MNFTYIIKRNDGKFYNGFGGWSKEYPDAWIYTNSMEARKVIKKKELFGVTLWRDYGKDNELPIENF